MDITSSKGIPVIIINWNGSKDTIECLNSLIKTQDVEYNIYVVDNNSKQEDYKLLESYCNANNTINLLRLDKNLGFAKANNLVLTHLLNLSTIPDYIALLNNDTVVENDWLAKLYHTATTHKASMVSSKMINYYDRTLMDNAGHKMLNTGEIIPIGHGQKINNYNQTKSNFGACAGACLYESNMLLQIGLFDEYFSTGYEDAEIGMRAKLRGYKCLYEPSAIVYHKGGTSIKKVFDKDYAIMIQNAIWYSYLKNVPTLVMIINMPFIIIKYILVIFLLLIRGKFNLAKLILNSIYQNLIIDNKNIRSNYKKLRLENINSHKIISSQRFFLFDDIMRLRRIIRQNKSALESYG